MLRIIVILLLSSLVFQCGNGRNFNSQKFTNLKKFKNQAGEAEPIITGSDKETTTTNADEIYWETNQSIDSSNQQKTNFKANELPEIYNNYIATTDSLDNDILTIQYESEEESNADTPPNFQKTDKPKNPERNTAEELLVAAMIWLLMTFFFIAIGILRYLDYWKLFEWDRVWLIILGIFSFIGTYANWNNSIGEGKRRPFYKAIFNIIKWVLIIFVGTLILTVTIGLIVGLIMAVISPAFWADLIAILLILGGIIAIIAVIDFLFYLPAIN